MPDIEDFYEDDEPVEDIIAAWNSGEAGTTSPPVPTFSVMVQSVYTGQVFPASLGVGKLVTDGPVNRGSLVAC